MSFSAEDLQEVFLSSSDPFFPLDDAPDDIFLSSAEFQTQNAVEEMESCSALFLEGTGAGLQYSSSPPCQQLENLTLYQSNWSYPTEAQPNGVRVYDCLEDVKKEKPESSRGYGNEAFISRSYDGCDDFNKYMMQRNGFVDETPEINNNVRTFSNGWIDSPQNEFFGGQIRRACSTGDLQFLRSTRARGSSPRTFSSSLAGETSTNFGEPNTKAVRCSAEEKKEKILKYRAKRAQRNFNKTIKYVCRKTLADNRRRIRGRFARNDEVGETRKATFLSNNDEEDGFWVGMHENREEFYGGGGDGDEGGDEEKETYVKSYGQAQGQLRYYYNY